MFVWFPFTPQSLCRSQFMRYEGDKGVPIEDDSQLTKLFSAIIERRSSLEEEDKRTKETQDRRTEDSLVAAQPLIAARHPGAPPV